MSVGVMQGQATTQSKFNLVIEEINESMKGSEKLINELNGKLTPILYPHPQEPTISSDKVPEEGSPDRNPPMLNDLHNILAHSHQNEGLLRNMMEKIGI